VLVDPDGGGRVGRTVVGERLAACVNVLAPCHSIFWWDGAIDSGEEVPALFKTTTDKVDALIARIAKLHSYEVPAIVAWPIDRLDSDYAGWVETTLA